MIDDCYLGVFTPSLSEAIASVTKRFTFWVYLSRCLLKGVISYPPYSTLVVIGLRVSLICARKSVLGCDVCDSEG